MGGRQRDGGRSGAARVDFLLKAKRPLARSGVTGHRPALSVQFAATPQQTARHRVQPHIRRHHLVVMSERYAKDALLAARLNPDTRLILFRVDTVCLGQNLATGPQTVDHVQLRFRRFPLRGKALHNGMIPSILVRRDFHR